MQKILLSIIGFYRKVVSPHLKPRCRFHPSCSEYAANAIRKYGSFRGIAKTVGRIVRCHPFAKGGVDLP
ncbi:MAG: membrane protein insertion efficiency factor YidD [Holosporaceae bacterium]|nr:membrane protein insertion efficiency factor YidD [Holosporaceae bacterium]